MRTYLEEAPVSTRPTQTLGLLLRTSAPNRRWCLLMRRARAATGIMGGSPH